MDAPVIKRLLGLTILILISIMFWCFWYGGKEHYSKLDSNNCYSYAFSDLSLNRKSKPQPGFKANLPALTKNQYKCTEFINRIKADYPRTKFIGNDPNMAYTSCNLIFLALDEENKDYHFYKRNNDWLWSHKPGLLDVSNIDSDGKIIVNPFYAKKNYGIYNYNTPCGFFCI